MLTSKSICTIGAALIAFVIMAPSMSTTAEARYIESHRGAKKQTKKFFRKNLIPTSMKCANPTNAKYLKPDVTFKTAPNKDKRAWVVLAYYGQSVWKPDTGRVGYPSTKPFSKRYSKMLTSSGSGRAFHCSLWIGPKGSLLKYPNPGISAKTSSRGILQMR